MGLYSEALTVLQVKRGHYNKLDCIKLILNERNLFEKYISQEKYFGAHCVPIYMTSELKIHCLTFEQQLLNGDLAAS